MVEPKNATRLLIIGSLLLLLAPQQSFAQQVGDGVIEEGEDEVAELACSICTGIRFQEDISSCSGFDPLQLGMPLQPFS